MKTRSLWILPVVFWGITPLALASSYSRSTRQASPLDFGNTSRVGLGMATFTDMGGSDVALSVWVEPNDHQSFQGVLAIGSTSPFQIGFGGAARWDIGSVGESSAFDLGGRLDLGSMAGTGKGSDFFLQVGPTAGFHFTIPGLNRVLVSFDAGMTLSVLNSNTNFFIGGVSPALGLAVHYFL